MSVVAVPETRKPAKQPAPDTNRGLILGILAGVVILGLAAWWLWPKSGPRSVITGSQMYEVMPMDLEIKVTKDGEIHAINNIDINCQVEGSSTITWIVKEGTSVKKGETLITLDSTQIRQRIEDTSLDQQKAQADVKNAEEMLDIQKSTNETNLESAEVALKLAELDIKQYKEGSYPQQLKNATTERDMTQITLENRNEDLRQVLALRAKDFVTDADVKKAKLDVLTAQQARDKAAKQLEILEKYSHVVDLTAKENTLLQATQRVLRTKRENNSNLSWRTADLTAKQQNLNVLKRRLARYQEQFEACTVKAPADGMVIYGSTTDRNAQTPIQEGAQVRDRQLLIRLPDTTAMKAVVRIHEAVVPKLTEGQRANVKIVGIPQQVGATLTKISVLADNSNRWWNPDLREYPVDLSLDVTPPNLKPGIGAVVEILVDRLAGVLAVPLDAVYSVGSDRYVFVRSGENVRPVKVSVGANNDTHVQILDGVSAGQQVLRLQAGQGRDLLEKAGIKVEPTTRPGTSGRDNGNGGAQAAGSSLGNSAGNGGGRPEGGGRQ